MSEISLGPDQDCIQKSKPKSRGRLLHGRLYNNNPDHPVCGGSIPTRFQRILMPPNTTLVRPNNRFDSKHFYKTLYNKDPGPGSYTLSTDSLETNPSISQTGYGVGFASKAIKNMSNTVYSNVGPGNYSPEKPSTKAVATRVFAYTGRKGLENDDMLKLNIPFDEKNPLNYIKPIALNVYIKPTLPGPGEYDINQKDSINNMAEAQFRSKSIKQRVRTAEGPGVGQYFLTEEIANNKKYIKRKPKSINRKKALKYEWLGEDAKLINKSYTEKANNNNEIEIINYGRLYEIQKNKGAKEKLEVVVENLKSESAPMASFAISDMDRFGCQMRPKRPFELKPGPADYEINLRNPNKGPVFKQSYHVNKKAARRLPPGPAFYNPQKEPAKLSFHLNVNKQWI